MLKKIIVIIIFIQSIILLTGCDKISNFYSQFSQSSPTEQASNILQQQMNSPPSYKKIYSKILWKGRSAIDTPAYIVLIKYQSSNLMGVPLVGCHIVSYSESIDHKNATWDKSYGLYDMQSMIMACEESTPTELLGEFVETLREVNKFKVDSAQNSNTENSPKKTAISETSNSKYSNESDIDLSKEDKTNEKFNFKISSDSKEFSGAKIGTKIKEYAKGEPLTVDGNMYFFTENGAHLAEGNDPNEKPGLNGTIYQITFSCVKSIFGKSKGFASIEGISCSSSPNAIEESKWKKYCNVYSFSSFDNQLDKIYLLNNAFINVHYDEKSNPFIDSFGLYMDKKSMLTAYRSCEEAEKLKVKAKQKGFKTLGDMVSEESNN